jgi:hypothetical protein
MRLLGRDGFAEVYLQEHTLPKTADSAFPILNCKYCSACAILLPYEDKYRYRLVSSQEMF